MKADCSYVSVNGARVHTKYILVKVTNAQGDTWTVRVALKSRGAKGDMYSLAKLRKLAAQGVKLEVCVTDRHSKQPLTDWVPFDASASRGGSGMFRRGRDASFDGAAQDDIPGQRLSVKPGAGRILADILVDGISYGNSKGVSSGNARQVELILAQAGGADVLVDIIRTGASRPFVDNVYTGSPALVGKDSALLVLRGLCDLIAANPTAVQEHAALFLEMFGTIETGRLLEAGVTLGYIPTGTDALLGAVTPKRLKALLPLVTGDVLTRVASCAGEELALEAMLQSNDGSFEAVRAVIDVGLMFEDAKEFLKLGGRIEEIKGWRSQGFTPQMLASYVAAGFVADADVLQLGVVPSGEGVLSAYGRAGWVKTIDYSSSSYVVYPSGSAIDEYRSLGFSSADIAILVRARILPQMAKGFVEAGITDASVLATIPVVPESRPAVSYRAGGSGYEFVATFQPENVSAIHARAAHLASVAQMTDQGDLGVHALKAKDPAVRLAAVKQMTDQVFLERIALNDEDPAVCLAAVANLTDNPRLVRIAFHRDFTRAEKPTHASVSLAAAAKLTDQKDLATVVRGSTIEYYRNIRLMGSIQLAVVEKLTDQETLAYVACKQGDMASRRRYCLAARMAAFEKLVNPDPGLLAEVATSDPDEDMRLAAIKRLVDPKPLAQVALVHGDPTTRLAAVERLTAQPELKQVAGTTTDAAVYKVAMAKIVSQADRDEVLRTRGVTQNEQVPANVDVASETRSIDLADVSQITDQVRLGELALNDKDPGVRLAAVKQMTDQLFLGRIVNRDQSVDVCLAAVANLTNEETLGYVAVYHTVESVSLAAAEKLTDQKEITRVARQAATAAIRVVAVEKLTDQKILARVVTDVRVADTSTKVRLAAVERLTDQTALAHAATRDYDSAVRLAAVERLVDPKPLAQVAVDDAAATIRLVAVERLTAQPELKQVAGTTTDAAVYKVAMAKIVSQADRDEVLRTRGQL